MGRKSFSEEQRWNTARQIEAGTLTVQAAAAALEVSANTIYRWMALYRVLKGVGAPPADGILRAENRRLKAELQRVTEERDILKKAALLFAQ